MSRGKGDCKGNGWASQGDWGKNRLRNPGSQRKRVFQEGLGINDKNCRKIRMESYFCPGVHKYGIFHLPLCFSCMPRHKQEGIPPHANCSLTHDRSAPNLDIVRPHSLLFHNFLRKHKEKVIIEFLKRKSKFIFQNEHSVSHFFRMITFVDMSKQQPFGAMQRAPFLCYILFSSYHTQLNKNNGGGEKRRGVKKTLICTVVMNRLDWALTQQAGDGHCLSISGLNFRLATGVFPFLALRPCHH